MIVCLQRLRNPRFTEITKKFATQYNLDKSIESFSDAKI
jgi:hypothetical protein